MAEDTRGSLLGDNLGWMQKTDILMGIGVIAVVAMLIIPIPTFLLDFLLSISIMLGILTLLVVMFVPRSNLSKKRKARRTASWTRSSALPGFLVSRSAAAYMPSR